MDLDQLDARLMREPSMAWPASVPGWAWAPAVALLVVVGLLWAAVVTRRRRKRRPDRLPARCAPDAAARSALARLRCEGLVRSGPAEPFYRALSCIVRVYIEDRFGCHASRLSTEEFLSSAVAGRTLPSGLRTRIGAFLRMCDLVKFARGEPEAEEREQAWHAATAIVTEGRVGWPGEGTP